MWACGRKMIIYHLYYFITKGQHKKTQKNNGTQHPKVKRSLVKQN